MTLTTFDRGLRRTCDATVQAAPGLTLDDLRPFVCAGSPLDCSVFLVGLNPASPDRGFWSFWNAGRGFERSAWLAAYEASRAAAGRTRSSRTRSRIRAFTLAVEAGGAKVLETNVYAVCTPRKRNLPVRLRNDRVFRFLLEAVRPRVVVAHGDDALTAVGAIYGVALARGAEVVLDGTVLLGRRGTSAGRARRPATSALATRTASGRERRG